MKTFLKILKWILISIIGIIGLLALVFFTYNNYFYEREMHQIQAELNKIENVEVINIWGHKDITLEEISVRLSIKDKGEIVIYGLSEDVFKYPERVIISEIGGYSFTRFAHYGGIGSSINIGNENELGKLIGKQFYEVKDVIDNYTEIIEVIENLKHSPDINHFESATSESYLLVKKENKTDQDPIFDLKGIENKFEFASTLKWNRTDSYFNRKE